MAVAFFSSLFIPSGRGGLLIRTLLPRFIIEERLKSFFFLSSEKSIRLLSDEDGKGNAKNRDFSMKNEILFQKEVFNTLIRKVIFTKTNPPIWWGGPGKTH